MEVTLLTSYIDFVEEECRKNQALSTLIDSLKSRKFKRILLFSDADPDGITAAAIMTHIFCEYQID